MLIKMRTTMAGPFGTYCAGTIAKIPDEKAEVIIAAGYAERVEAQEVKKEKAEEKPKLETAMAETGENAMIDPPPRRRRKKNAQMS